jgi:hypothetical protein
MLAPIAGQETTESGMNKTDPRDKPVPGAQSRPQTPPPPPSPVPTQAYVPLPLEEETASIKPPVPRRRTGPVGR